MATFSQVTEFVKKYERHLSSAALLVGFIVDNLTLGRVDQTYDNLVLIFYIFLAGFCILLLNFVEIRALTSLFATRVRVFVPIIIQYAFGGLFSAFFVFYSRSGSFWSSWPFILLIVVLLILNEFLKERYSRLLYQVGIYFFTIFSYMIFLVPLILKQIGQLVFILSGIISLAVIYFFTILIHVATRQKYFQFNKRLWLIIGLVFVVMNVFYFTNILPPLPLSMKDSGAYNLVEKVDGNYVVSRENISWFRDLFSNKITVKSTAPEVYFFSSVYAPTKLATEVIHVWQKYDVVNKKWVQVSKINFPIAGGREEGYRGYSVKRSLSEGKWRVQTKTLNGQIIGAEKFTIVFTDSPLELEKTVK